MSNELEGRKAQLQEMLRRSYGSFAWHGPNLLHALRGAGLPEIAWRPAGEPQAWNIHEVTLHVADIMQRCSAALFAAPTLREINQDAFPLSVVVSEEEWSRTLAFLRRSYATLKDGLRAMPASRLTALSPSAAYNRRWSIGDHLEGVALHNVYHAAQIVALRKRQGAWVEHC
jgi:hypothetical protein